MKCPGPAEGFGGDEDLGSLLDSYWCNGRGERPSCGCRFGAGGKFGHLRTRNDKDKALTPDSLVCSPRTPRVVTSRLSSTLSRSTVVSSLRVPRSRSTTETGELGPLSRHARQCADAFHSYGVLGENGSGKVCDWLPVMGVALRYFSNQLTLVFSRPSSSRSVTATLRFPSTLT